MKFQILFISLITLMMSSALNAQESNIRTFTPSALLGKGQWDFKVFNNLYTENEGVDESSNISKRPMAYFYTSTFEIQTGVSTNKRVNVGIIANVKSNITNGFNDMGEIDNSNGLSELFTNQEGISRTGLTSIAPSIKYTPFESMGNFSIQSSFYIPLFEEESVLGVFLDRKSFIFENRIFYDRLLTEKIQLFLELDLNYQFGDSLSFEYDNELMRNVQSGGFSNDSFATPASVFISYFPSDNFTIYGMTQHYTLIDAGNNFSQNFTQSGVGAKYQISDALNAEILYTNFWRGASTGLGQTFNFGLRYLLK